MNAVVVDYQYFLLAIEVRLSIVFSAVHFLVIAMMGTAGIGMLAAVLVALGVLALAENFQPMRRLDIFFVYFGTGGPVEIPRDFESSIASRSRLLQTHSLGSFEFSVIQDNLILRTLSDQVRDWNRLIHCAVL